MTAKKKTTKKKGTKTATKAVATKTRPKEAYAVAELKADIANFEELSQLLVEKGKDNRLELIFVEILQRRAEKEAQEGVKWFSAVSTQQEYHILIKLCADWSIGASDREACIGAGVSRSSLSRYLKENPELKQFRDELRETPILIARRSVVSNLERDYGLAFRFLQSKKPKEFAIGRFASEAQGGDAELSEEEEALTREAFQLL